jgi:hypothetical protein
MSEHSAEKDAPFLARDLGPQHHGWLVKIPNGDHDPTRVLPGPERRTITLGGTRHWTYDGADRCGLLDLALSGPWRGTEYHVSADAEVTLVRQIKKGIPRARKGDYATSSMDKS